MYYGFNVCLFLDFYPVVLTPISFILYCPSVWRWFFSVLGALTPGCSICIFSFILIISIWFCKSVCLSYCEFIFVELALFLSVRIPKFQIFHLLLPCPPNSSQRKTSFTVFFSSHRIASFTPFPEEAALRSSLLGSKWLPVARPLFCVHVKPCSEVPGRKTRLCVLISGF